LSVTALSSLVSSYFGGFLLNYFTVRQMFISTSLFSLLTLASGIIIKENPRATSVGGQPRPLCLQARKNWSKVWQFLRLPFIYLPVLFIFLVVLAPGCDDAMFYFQTNVLHFDNN
jgi:hypothetical protein